jgi:hypothetical protein
MTAQAVFKNEPGGLYESLYTAEANFAVARSNWLRVPDHHLGSSIISSALTVVSRKLARDDGRL